MPATNACFCVQLNPRAQQLLPQSSACLWTSLLEGHTPVYLTGPLVGAVDVIEVLRGDISQHRDLCPALLGSPLDG